LKRARQPLKGCSNLINSVTHVCGKIGMNIIILPLLENKGKYVFDICM
jgi:hypothetical protein